MPSHEASHNSLGLTPARNTCYTSARSRAPPAAACPLPFHWTRPVGPQRFPLDLPGCRVLLPDVPWLPALSAEMKSPKAALYPSLPPLSQFAVPLKATFTAVLGTRQAPPTPHAGQEAELLGTHGLSFFLSIPSPFVRREQKTEFEYLTSEFSPKNQHFLASHCSKWAQSK